MKILYAEDEAALSEAVVDILTYNKYIVDAVYDGEAAFEYAMAGDYDGVILDIMMPKMSGLEVLAELRRRGYKKPVLLLTARTQVEDRIAGLDAGADDYLPKPFDMRELLARVRAMLRRQEDFRPDLLQYADLTLNLKTAELSSGGKTVVLPKQEYRLLEQLMLNRAVYLSSEDLLVKAWGYDTDADINSVWFYISQLRKRFESLGSHVGIVSKRNFGYKLEIKA